MAGGGGGDSGEFGLQIAPMLDVMFVLLLFFMVSAGSQQRETELSIKIPSKGKSTGETAPTPIMVKITGTGDILFNDVPVGDKNDIDLPKLTSKLKTATTDFDPKQAVIIIPTRNAKHSRVVDVLNACSAANVRNLSFGAPAR